MGLTQFNAAKARPPPLESQAQAISAPAYTHAPRAVLTYKVRSSASISGMTAAIVLSTIVVEASD